VPFYFGKQSLRRLKLWRITLITVYPPLKQNTVIDVIPTSH